MSPAPVDSGVVLQAPPRKNPDIDLPHVRVWQLTPADRDETPNAVDAWLLRVEPRWAYWLFGAISLDPDRGFDRRQLQFPEATHEFAIWQLDPASPLPDPGRWENADYIDPAEIKYQVELHPRRRGDLEAKVVLGQMVGAVVEWQMSPERANRDYWQKAITAVAEDFRRGRRRVPRAAL